MQILMNDAQLMVSNAPNGVKLVEIMDPRSGLTVVVPLERDAARNLAEALRPAVLDRLAQLPPLAEATRG